MFVTDQIPRKGGGMHLFFAHCAWTYETNTTPDIQVTYDLQIASKTDNQTLRNYLQVVMYLNIGASLIIIGFISSVKCFLVFAIYLYMYNW